ncbi:MAG: alanine racemase [Acidimicrobiales bacterium]
MLLPELSTPALVIDGDALDHNVAAMASVRPGAGCRPHVKAFKCTALARLLDRAGHHTFCAATTREIIGMAHAGLGTDLLLANETLDLARLRAMADLDGAVTVAVDSPETIDAAARAGIGRVLIDVNVGLARCGCAPEQAGFLAERARRRGLEVRGVMGYEGHLVGLDDREARRRGLERAMALLVAAHELVGGAIISGGGTGTYDLNTWVTEVQAGSYTLMDTAYARLGLPFQQALAVAATVISGGTARPPRSVAGDTPRRYFVADAGLKALGMDHGPPELELSNGQRAIVWFCSDEHITFSLPDNTPADTPTPAPEPELGSLVAVRPAHVDPTVAYHDRFTVLRAGNVSDEWPIDLRGW